MHASDTKSEQSITPTDLAKASLAPGHTIRLLSTVTPLLAEVEWDVSVLDHVSARSTLSTNIKYRTRLTGSACALSSQIVSRSRSTRLASRRGHRSPLSRCTIGQ
jgi:hypothetical protein